ncbi:putative a part of riboflavin biosynthesis protein RibD [Burkholderia pseudomallei MSHR5596]|nr:putative a part of riboflavin biosynthesis protein RibD [Burkholderia pseudomallei MSHR5596]
MRRAANRFQPRCRISDGFGKVPPDQRVGRRMLRMSTSLPTKIVEKAAVPARWKQAEKRRCALAAMREDRENRAPGRAAIGVCRAVSRPALPRAA